MYLTLRPEIRAAQRVLRSLQHPPSSSTHRTVRSFTSYVRLQAQSGTSGNDEKPETSKATDLSSPKTHQAHEFIQFFTNKTHSTATKNDSSETFQHSSFPDIDFTDLARRGEEEKKEIDEALKRGQVPAGYRLVDNLDDVPQELKSLAISGVGLQVPFLVSEDPGKLVKGISLPKDFGEAKALKSQSTKSIEQHEVDKSGSDQFSADRSSAPTGDLFHGSPNARRKRARTIRGTRTPKEETPLWVLENNLKLTRLSQTRKHLRPGVWSTFLKKDGTSEPARMMGSHLLQASDEQQSTKKTTMNSQEEMDKLDDKDESGSSGSDINTPSPSEEPDDSDSSSRTLSNPRYFIDVVQQREVANTFEGRLRRFNDPGPNRFPGPSASNHLAIYHTAKDADLLLYQLIDDMCMNKNADLLRLDAHDISALIAQADVDQEVVDRGGRASFSIFKNIYAPTTGFFDATVPQGDEVEDGMGEDDDVANPRGSIDIPVSFSYLPPLNGSKSFLGGMRQKLFGSGGPLGGFLEPGDFSGKSRNGMFSSMIDSIFTSTTKKVKTEYGRQIDEQAKDGEDVSFTKKKLDHRPLVVHVPDIRAIQEHPLTGTFLSELLEAADVSTKAGRHVMVVGTDCLRDLSTHANANSIIDMQENKPIPSATAIVLTPVFPTQDARLALLEDRRRRIATINARHLWSVIHSGRGTLLKGLEAGFWTRDLLKEIGEKDYEALARSYLSYSKVQRIASILNAEQFRQSQTPIHDAMHLIDTSDQGKLLYIKRSQPDLVKEVAKEGDKMENRRLAQIQATATRHEKKLLNGVVEAGKISTTFKDIHIPTDTIETLQTLTTLSLVRPDAFRYGVLKSDRIPGLLLYGPPGTGKTLAAKAVAKESGATMLEVSAANLNDMYVGEGEKNVQALFSLAKKLSPCVVFLDEADAMFSARAAQGRRVSHRELLNQFLREWDGMSNDAGSAFIMVATNRPMDLDDAVLRRLPRRILVDLPTEQDRFEILKIHLRQEDLAEDVNMADIAKKTPFYSGSDLKNVAVAAALNAVREEHEAAKKYSQENPDGAEYQYPEKRTLTKSHFEKALEEISASISEDMTSLKDIKKFDEQYGDKRGKRKKTPKWGFRSPVEADQKRETVRVRS